MSKYSPPTVSKYWRLHISLDPKTHQNEPPYALTLWIGIVALNCKEALQLCETRHPGFNLHSIHCNGDIHYGSL